VEDGGVLSCAGVSRPAQPFFSVLVSHLFPGRTIVLVAESLKSQESFLQDVTTWLQLKEAASQQGGASSKSFPLFYPAWETLPHEARLPHPDVIGDRLESLVALARHERSPGESASTRIPAPIVVSTAAALMQRTFTRESLRDATRRFEPGARIDPLDLVEWLEAQGYEPEAQVTQKGELSLRGGILDVFPPTNPWPVRFEFFGDDLESLRQFDPLNQISREPISSITIPPAGEIGILQKNELHHPGSLGSLLEFLPADSILILCEPELLEERAREYQSQIPEGDPYFIAWEDFVEQATGRGLTVVRVEEAATAILDDSEALTMGFESLDAFRPVPERAPEPQVAEVQRREFFNQMHRWLRQDFQVRVFCNNDGESRRFQEIWNEYGLSSGQGSGPLDKPEKPAGKADRLNASPVVHIGPLGRGFICEQARLVAVADAEIFGRYKVQRPRRLTSPHAQATRSALDIDFADLEEGDYVVHLQHGIGRYLGLKVLPIGAGRKGTDAGAPQTSAAGTSQECLVIEYARGNMEEALPRLYVPVTEAHLISKYVGAGKARPQLNTLGGGRWAKTKEHAERAVRDVAGELLAIQAARDSQPGHSFAADSAWQDEFEAAFIFTETPDQLRAILETKADMERPKPMDRLICGDVGFGKTEIAIRAAFKSVMDGKQVALLVPTTVLAQQHFNTFRERMADYPVRIELLSRFRPRRVQQRVVKDLAAGSVDIVIGTHRLLQDDIGFKDLGLVVIDEEQRFGVLHKEKFKMLRKLVDVLTLSATPIPRTLYLALTGARDMSTIQTPPHDRLPVETIVTGYDERVIRDAIQRELNRGGQVFFLHNRVMTIETMASKLRTLLPSARILVGHGQMHSDELEEVMTRFVNGEADVLLSTTIIESGLDIPNANTIIIDRADRFGLSDLYQLRGRVGRYKHQAYAYMLLPRHGSLLTDVRKRLSAIKQYSTLGSGFKIAMRDLEIRGAGNLLGSEQSGHITAVGFELYCQLLKQSVAALKGEKVKPRVEVQMRLDFLSYEPGGPPQLAARLDSGDSVEPRSRGLTGSRRMRESKPAEASAGAPASACIPLSYIADPRQRIEIYRKLALTTTRAEVDSLEKEMRDRFGPVPAPLTLLLRATDLRILAADHGITAIEVNEDRLMLTRNNDFIMEGSKFPRLTKKDAVSRLGEIKKLLLAL
jgi:transcription-repair coupling factor (superfamily II helicase)